MLYGRPRSSRSCARRQAAGVVELVDTPDLGSGGSRRGGSSPSARTTASRSLDGRGWRRADGLRCDGSRAEGHQGREAMQVTELSADGLRREYKVIVQAQEIE